MFNRKRTACKVLNGVSFRAIVLPEYQNFKPFKILHQFLPIDLVLLFSLLHALLLQGVGVLSCANKEYVLA